jgi:Lrp/AsnC family transcriptional regulator for asnA, asnC and gidA
MRHSKPPAGTAVVQLDEVDRGIIAALQQDGRAGNSAIAVELGVTEGTVRQRIKKLLDADLLRVTGLVNPEVMPDHQLCVLGVKIDESKQLEARARAVSALPEVRSVAIVTGRYDLLVEVIVSSNHGLIQFLSESLASVPGIESSETFLLLKTYGKWV